MLTYNHTFSILKKKRHIFHQLTLQNVGIKKNNPDQTQAPSEDLTQVNSGQNSEDRCLWACGRQGLWVPGTVLTPPSRGATPACHLPATVLQASSFWHRHCRRHRSNLGPPAWILPSAKIRES